MITPLRCLQGVAAHRARKLADIAIRCARTVHAGAVTCAGDSATPERPAAMGNFAVSARAIKWGGNVRNVLTHPERDYQDMLRKARNAATVSVLEECLSYGGAHSEVADKYGLDAYFSMLTVGQLQGAEVSAADTGAYAFSHADFVSAYAEEALTVTAAARQPLEARKLMHLAEERERRSDPALHPPTDEVMFTRGKEYEFDFRSHRWRLQNAMYRRTVVVPALVMGPRTLPLERLSPAPAAAAATAGQDSLKQPALLQGSELAIPAALPMDRFHTADHLAEVWHKGSSADDCLFVPLDRRFNPVHMVLRLQGQPIFIHADMRPRLHPVAFASLLTGGSNFASLVEAVGLGAPDAEVPFVWVWPKVAYGEVQHPAPVDAATSGTPAFFGQNRPDKAGSAPSPAGLRVVQYKARLDLPPLGAADQYSADDTVRRLCYKSLLKHLDMYDVDFVPDK